MADRSLLLEIQTNNHIQTTTFGASGECLIIAEEETIQLRRVKGDTKVPTRILSVEETSCLAVSKDDRWIAAGTLSGNVFVWDVTTGERVFSHQDDNRDINGVDFSPDSARLVIASDNRTATVWDVAARTSVIGPLRHDHWVIAAKYSSQGDRLAVGTLKSVYVYHGDDGRLLVEIPVGVVPHYNTGLLWSGIDQLLMLSDDKVRRFEVPARSITAEWPALKGNEFSCIALPQHREFIVCSIERTVTFWDMSTRTYLGSVQHPEDISSIAISPDGSLLAISGGQKCTIQSLFHIADSIPLARLHPTFQEPDIQIDDASLDSWERDQLASAEASLSLTISASLNPTHHVLASRALVRTRLRQWDDAIDDAEQSIKIQPSVMGYIAKSVAHIGKGEREKGYRTYDIAFEHFHSTHVSFLLLVKAIIISLSGDYNDAILRVNDLMSAAPFNSICFAVQAYIYLLLGNSQMESSDYDGAIQSFEYARTQMRHYGSRPLVLISLISGWKFDHLGITIQRQLCEALYEADRPKEGVDLLLQMPSTSSDEVHMNEPICEWVSSFKTRCSEKLEHLGDEAMNAQRYDDAITHYSGALAVYIHNTILIKRSKALMANELWDDALSDANEAIARDPSSPWVYKIKHAILHRANRYDDAVEAFETMLLQMEQSPDPAIRELRDQYISPSYIRAKICRTVQQTVQHLPRVLINTLTGHLQDRAERASSLESSPIFSELLSSMTTRIDGGRIKHEVGRFFQYVMLSHRWDENEPSFQKVIRVAVYDLDESPTHNKLKTFCKIARDSGFNWAWCDTCCIDKQDNFVLQEALVAMFRWYRDSAMVIVYLRDVHSPAKFGELMKSTWNTRGWTFQEYIAAKAVNFYTEDWKLYRDITIPNHKESPEIVSEMERVTLVSAERLMALLPGLNSIREKLYLASTRQTTLVEDAAYSLLGIFSVTGMPAIYGEGESALGRLLAHILSASGDLSILAWTGQSSQFNSCLPARIIVYRELEISHLPLPINAVEMENAVTALRGSMPDVCLAVRLYDRLNERPTPWFAASRMKLPCIAFQLPPLSPRRTRLGRVYCAETPTLGMVEIRTRRDLPRQKPLYLIHPWLDALLGRENTQVAVSIQDDVGEPSPSISENEDTDVEEADFEDSDFSPLTEPELSSLPTLVDNTALPDRETRALHLVARLRQPFGALLFMLASASGREEYVRVAAENLITVQVQESVSLDELLDNVRILDVL